LLHSLYHGRVLRHLAALVAQRRSCHREHVQARRAERPRSWPNATCCRQAGTLASFFAATSFITSISFLLVVQDLLEKICQAAGSTMMNCLLRLSTCWSSRSKNGPAHLG